MTKINVIESLPIVLPIINDDLLETNETFTAEISLTRIEDRNCIVLRRSTAEITILDDDGEAKFGMYLYNSIDTAYIVAFIII